MSDFCLQPWLTLYVFAFFFFCESERVISIPDLIFFVIVRCRHHKQEELLRRDKKTNAVYMGQEQEILTPTYTHPHTHTQTQPNSGPHMLHKLAWIDFVLPGADVLTWICSISNYVPPPKKRSSKHILLYFYMLHLYCISGFLIVFKSQIMLWNRKHGNTLGE